MAMSRGLVLAIALHSICGPSAFYSASSMNLLQQFIMAFANASLIDHYGIELSSSGFAWFWSCIASLDSLTSLFTMFCFAWLLDKFGRRFTFMVVNNVLGIAASVFQLIAKPLNSFEAFAIGRLLLGVSLSLVRAPAIIYLAECSPDSQRGKATQMFDAGFGGWIVFATIISFSFLLGTEELWSYFYLVPIPFAAYHLFSSFFIPKSPKYLYIRCNDVVGARRSLHFYHGDQFDEPTILARYDIEALQASQNLNFGEIFNQHHLLKPLLIAIIANLTPSFVALDTLNSYEVPIFRWIGLSQSTSVVIYFLVMFFGSMGSFLSSIFVIERFSRRFLFLASIVVHMVDLLFLMIACWGQPGESFGLETGSKELSSLTIASLVLYVALQVVKGSVKPGFLAILLVGEICPQGSRAKVMQIVLIVHHLFSFVMGLLFPPIVNCIGAWIFAILIAFSAVCVLWLSRNLPETRQRAVEEVVAEYVEEVQEEALPLLE